MMPSERPIDPKPPTPARPRTGAPGQAAASAHTAGRPVQAQPVSPQKAQQPTPRSAPGAAPTRTEPSAKSPAPRDPRGLSAIEENNLERSAIRRGLLTQQELDACKALRAKSPEKSLVEVMVGASVLTKNQALRLLKELGDGQQRLEIPGYEIIEKLGKGSMGVVYKARQTSVDRIVAVKVLLDSLSQNRDFVSRFQREAKIAAKLSHANIVNAIDAGQAGTYQFFVMEYVEGETIKDMLEKGKIFEEKEALEIVVKVADALKHANQRGLIHRDIKPENMILTSEGMVKLADLGLARPTGDAEWAKAEYGMAIGTPYYISPEQVRGQVDVDIRADVYGLGGTLYHMVTGRVPYPGDTPTEVMKKHADKAVVLTPPDHLNTRLSSGLGEVVETMMAKDRDQRYATPDDVIMDLQCLLAGERPMIAQRKADALAKLDEGEQSEAIESEVTEEEKAEMAAVVNSRNTVISILAVLLAVSAVTNLIVLLAR
jgi:serine/threonine-protein kinase